MKHFVFILLLSSVSVFLYAQNNVGPGNGLTMNGSGQYVDLGPSLRNMTFPITFCIWIKPDNTATRNVFTSNKSGSATTYHGVWINVANDRIVANMGNGTGGFSANSRNSYRVNFSKDFFGEWIHLAVVFRGVNDMKIYVNGILQSGTYSGSSAAYTNNYNGFAWLGQGKADNYSYFKGSMDEFSLWDKELSQTEIRNLMCRKVDTSAADLLMAYDFNETSSATTFTNRGSIATNGTRVGATTISSDAPVGDVSVDLYASSPSGFNNQSTSMGAAGVGVQISDLQAPAKGVHLYATYNFPSSTVSSCLGDTLYGVFLAEDDFTVSDAFNINFQNKTVGQERRMLGWTWNTVSTSTLNQISRRGEFLMQANVNSSVLPPDTVLCAGQTITLTLPAGGQYFWSDGTTGNTNVLSGGDTLWVADTTSSCPIADTIIAQEMNLPTADPVDTSLCNGQTLYVELPVGPSYQWSDGSTNRIRNLTFGNYAVDMTFGGCTSSINYIVREIQTITPPFTDTAICSTDSVFLNAPNNVNILWADGGQGERWLYPGQTTAIVWQDGPCEVVYTLSISALSGGRPNIQIPLQTTICAGDAFVAEIPSTVTDVVWIDGSTDVPRTITQEGTYRFRGYSGCDSIYYEFDVIVAPCDPIDLWIPNAFTPNNDGLNDVLYLANLGGVDFTLTVHSRWGQVVFETSNPSEGWDGTYEGEPLQEGVYAYQIVYQDLNGELKSKSGTIQILR